MTPNPEFFQALVSTRSTTAAEALALSGRHRGDAFSALSELVNIDPVNKAVWCHLWADSINVAYVELDKTVCDDALVRKVPRAVAESLQIIPLYQFGTAVTVAFADPRDRACLQEVTRLFGCVVSPVFGWPDDIQVAIELHYQSDQALLDTVSQIVDKPWFREGGASVTPEWLRRVAGEQAVVDFTHGLLLLAAKERASDIHIEPRQRDARIRFRIDGVLQDRLSLTRPVLPPLVSRLKVMALADISEKRKPQDGRLSVPLPGRSLDFRFSAIPTVYGEKVVLRLLGELRRATVPAITDLGFSRANLDVMKRILARPNGIFLVTGPTGCGKSTTLYGMLRHLNQPGVNITTIEDPVEYRLDGVNQVQVNPAAGIDFATALRSFLRQDPDIILVGEIRDLETARIALQASLTGHLVLTTLHTNSAVEAIARLMDLGAEPYLVAPALIGCMAQRLVRRICTHCREPYKPDRGLLDELFEWDGTSDVMFYRGKGCDACAGSGYFGRMAIHELLVMTDEMRRRIAHGATSQDITELSRRSGFTSMRYDGLKKVLRGVTTLDEVNRMALAD